MTLAERHRRQHFRSKLEANHSIDTESFRCRDCGAPMCFTCGWCSGQCGCDKQAAKTFERMEENELEARAGTMDR